MRTAIFFGLYIIGNAIRPDYNFDDSTITFLAILSIAIIMMDVLEFFKYMTKKD